MLRAPPRNDDGDLDTKASAEVPGVVTLDLDETRSARIAPEITDETRIGPLVSPSSSSDKASEPPPLPSWPVCSTIGRAIPSVLSESPKFAVDPEAEAPLPLAEERHFLAF